MSNGQLKGFAVESLIRESGADFSSKELKDVSRNVRLAPYLDPVG
jgi:hypothetical protein